MAFDSQVSCLAANRLCGIATWLHRHYRIAPDLDAVGSVLWVFLSTRRSAFHGVCDPKLSAWKLATLRRRFNLRFTVFALRLVDLDPRHEERDDLLCDLTSDGDLRSCDHLCGPTQTHHA